MVYEIDAVATQRAGTPVMREVDREDAPALAYTDRLPNGLTVWGQAIRAVRLHLSRTQQEVADHLGVTTRTLVRWETGERVPRPGPAAWYWLQMQRLR